MPLPIITSTQVGDYFLQTARNADWVAVASKDIVVHEAQTWLGQLCLDSTRSCCGLNFVDAWLMAVSEVSLALSQNPNAVIPSGVTTSTGTKGAIKSQKLGDLQQDFYDVKDGSASTGGRFGPNDPKILQAFDWVYDILSCYLVGVRIGKSGLILRVRS